MSTPEPVARGRYAIYETPDGGAVLAYRPDGAQEDFHHAVPAKFWKLFTAAMRGEQIDLSPGAVVKLMMGRG